jgi:hypothetical protein
MLNHNLSQTFSVSESVSGRIIPFIRPFTNMHIIEFTSLDGASIAVPQEIEVWGPDGVKFSPGSTFDEDKSYFILESPGDYNIHANGIIVQTITLLPIVPVLRVPV